MRTYQTIQLRRFNILIMDKRTGKTREDVIVLTKQQLQAAQVVGQSSKELICRYYAREGFTVLEIISAVKREATLDLDELFREAVSD